jgi:hypothetical protein
MLTVLLCFFAGALCLAENANMGTWKLNESKSKIPAGAPKNTTVIYEMAGDKIKVTVEGVDGEGKPTHYEWTGMFDGKDYPVTGDAASDSRSYKEVNDHTLELTNKKGGKVTVTGKAVVSADGKTRTINTTGKNAKGETVKTMGVYDKQ